MLLQRPTAGGPRRTRPPAESRLGSITTVAFFFYFSFFANTCGRPPADYRRSEPVNSCSPIQPTLDVECKAGPAAKDGELLLVATVGKGGEFFFVATVWTQKRTQPQRTGSFLLLKTGSFFVAKVWTLLSAAKDVILVVAKDG